MKIIDLKKELKDAGISLDNFVGIRYAGEDQQTARIIKRVKAEMAQVAKAVLAGRLDFSAARKQLFDGLQECFSIHKDVIADGRFFHSNIVSYRRNEFIGLFETMYNFIMLVYQTPDELIEMMSQVTVDAYDFNGLKAINDFAGKDNGTLYLLDGVRILCNNDYRSKRFAQLGIQSLFCTFGGDEFCELRWGDLPTENLMQYHHQIDEAIQRMETRRYLDFSDAAVLARFHSHNVNVPKQARLVASVARGTVSLDEVFAATLESENAEAKLRALQRKNPAGMYRQRFDIVLKALLDFAEAGCALEKDRYYIAMKKSYDPVEQFQVLLRMRNQEAAQTAQENSELREAVIMLSDEVERLKDENSVLRSALLQQRPDIKIELLLAQTASRYADG